MVCPPICTRAFVYTRTDPITCFPSSNSNCLPFGSLSSSYPAIPKGSESAYEHARLSTQEKARGKIQIHFPSCTSSISFRERVFGAGSLCKVFSLVALHLFLFLPFFFSHSHTQSLNFNLVGDTIRFDFITIGNIAMIEFRMLVYLLRTET